MRDHRRAQVDFHHEVVARHRDVEVADERDRRVVDEDVEPTEMLDRRRHHRDDLVGLVRQVRRDGLGVAARVDAQRRRCRRACPVSSSGRRAVDRAAHATAMPACGASATAVAAPTPRLAPVTSATLPFELHVSPPRRAAYGPPRSALAQSDDTLRRVDLDRRAVRDTGDGLDRADERGEPEFARDDRGVAERAAFLGHDAGRQRQHAFHAGHVAAVTIDVAGLEAGERRHGVGGDEARPVTAAVPIPVPWSAHAVAERRRCRGRGR